MQSLLIVIHIITCLILVVTVLLQQGKGAEVGAVFGSSEAIFGSAGPATLLSKITTVCAIIFMLTSLSLTYLSIQKRGESVMHNVQQVPMAPVNQPITEKSTMVPETSNVEKEKDVQKTNPSSKLDAQDNAKNEAKVVPIDKARRSVEKGTTSKAGEKLDSHK